MANVKAYVIILAGLGVAYAPALLGHYAHLDDYLILGRWETAPWHNYPYFHDLIVRGRFLGALVAAGFSFLVDNVGDLNRLRAISLILLSICAFICFRFARAAKVDYWPALLTTIIVFTLPPFEVIVAWAACVVIATAIFIAVMAAVVARKSKAAAVLLLVVSLLIYQPAAMFYWVMAALAVLPAAAQSDFKTRPAVMLFGIGLCAAGIYAVITAVSHRFITVDPGHIMNPFEITGDYLGKISWFFKEPLVNSLNLWNIYPSKKAAILGGLFIVASWLHYYFNGKNKGPAVRICALTVTLLFLSFLPNLLARTNLGAYRCSLALTPLVVIALWMAVNYWADRIFKSTGRNIFTIILIVGSLLGVYKAYDNILRYRVVPSQRELGYMKAALAKDDLSRYREILVVHPRRFSSDIRVRYEEFVTPSLSYLCFLCMVSTALSELGFENQFTSSREFILAVKIPGDQGPRVHYPKISMGFDDGPPVTDPSTLVIDMARFFNYVTKYTQ